MPYYIGIDLGTSAVKLLLADENGAIHNVVTKEYPLLFPRPGWCEQDPAAWARAVWAGMPELLRGFDASLVRGIGAGGQMHGLVALDEDDRVIRPAILWNDARTEKQTAYLNEAIGRETLSQRTANIAFAGFTAPKLLWMRAQEPENFKRIRKIMLPKDYVNFLLTGAHCTDYSDASGTLLLDVRGKCWNADMLALCGVTQAQLPALHESGAPVGTVLPAVARALGLPEGVVVCAGAGDNAAAAVGTGTVGEGGCNISLGTSGTVFISSETFRVDPHNALHAFAHADGGFHLMGVALSAAACNKWLMEDILATRDYTAEQAAIRPERLGRNEVFFLPYLMGERSPINDTAARGTFTGLTLNTARADITQAVLEGVAFAIRDSVEVARGLGIVLSESRVCGGGAKSALWKQILANVLNLRLHSVASEQGPGMGGAMLAMVACGAYPDVPAACRKLVRIRETIAPDPALAALYEDRYRKFRKIYPAMKELFAALR